ncbi:MAG: sulfate transporter [Betaproteobacteria bacterium]|nr:sulfate transporter [Betaproteobacteria bacterium]
MEIQVDRASSAPSQPARNRFDRLEWAGAFGDLGTLIPFVVAYISLLKLDPFGVLFAFGATMIACGIYYRTPFPVQPMKAIGVAATGQAIPILPVTPGAVYGAGLITGLVWFVLGVTGSARKVAQVITRPVALGIIMGLGLTFALEGIKLMAGGWVISAIGFSIALLLLTNRQIPAMFLLLLFGAVAAVVQNPALLEELAGMRIDLRLPTWALGSMSWSDLVVGALVLALPQIPLTLGNAVIAITEENNRLFPDRRVNENGVATSTGLMNLFGPLVGGVPMCHGAGGMAGHVRFGAHTGGATIILGSVLVLAAVFLSGSIETLFRIFPQPVLGVILFLTGIQLALGGTCDFKKVTKEDRFAHITTAALAMWNIGAAFVLGVALHHLMKRGVIKI